MEETSNDQIIYLLFGYKNNKRNNNTRLLGIYYTLEEIKRRQKEVCYDERTFTIDEKIARDKEWTTFYRKYLYGNINKELF